MAMGCKVISGIGRLDSINSAIGRYLLVESPSILVLNTTAYHDLQYINDMFLG